MDAIFSLKGQKLKDVKHLIDTFSKQTNRSFAIRDSHIIYNSLLNTNTIIVYVNKDNIIQRIEIN